MRPMTLSWERLSKAVRTARRARGWTQHDLAVAAGIGFSTVQRLESGESYTRRPMSLDRVERALDWASGSVDIILTGGDPLPIKSAEDTEQSPRPAEPSPLPRRLTHELTEGEVVDHEVIDLSSGGLKLIVIATTPRPETPEDEEQVAEDLREWTRVQRQLRGIVSHKDDPKE